MPAVAALAMAEPEEAMPVLVEPEMVMLAEERPQPAVEAILLVTRHRTLHAKQQARSTTTTASATPTRRMPVSTGKMLWHRPVPSDIGLGSGSWRRMMRAFT